MSRRSRDADILAMFALVVTLVIAWMAAEVGQRLRTAGAVTAAAPTPTPVAVVPTAEPTACPTATPTPPRVVRPCQIPGYPLWFCNPGGKLELPWYENFDATNERCVRKMLALVSREGSPFATFKQYRDDRWWAAWRACPEFRR